MEIFEILLFLMVLNGIISVPSQFNIVQTLKKNGYNTTIFMFLFYDLRKFRKLIHNETDIKIKQKMKLTYYGFIIPIILAISCFISGALIMFLTNR